jgi:hypothetical protein
MKIVVLICRILLGLAFLASGVMKFIPSLSAGQMPGGAAGQFMSAMMSTHYILVVGFFEAVSGVLLLINRYVPLALTFLGPIIVNILIVGILLTPMAAPSGALMAALWLVVFWSVRSAFAGIFQARTAS